LTWSGQGSPQYQGPTTRNTVSTARTTTLAENIAAEFYQCKIWQGIKQTLSCVHSSECFPSLAIEASS